MLNFQSAPLFVTALSLLIWIVLIFFWGGFWRCDRRLDAAVLLEAEAKENLSVCAVVPARNEAEVLPKTLRSLLQQSYPLTVVLVDDGSSDGTADIAREIAASLNLKVATPTAENPATTEAQLYILSSQPLPQGWTGKLWALEQGTRFASGLNPPPDYLLLSDADIDRVPTNVESLLVKARTEALELVSLMVLLRCQSPWEKLLVPAFVFFFQKLYPFSRANDPKKSTAAAAGGCILLKREALERIGGLAQIKNALIDDCALAKAVKSSNPEGKIWLGLTESASSLRPYDSLETLWDMVARTAFTQLHYSPLLLLGALAGMMLVYLVPPTAAIWGISSSHGRIAIAGFLAWFLMTVAYLPTLRLYRLSPLRALTLPFVAFLYSLMTFDSALRHWQGRGGRWKGRSYSA